MLQRARLPRLLGTSSEAVLAELDGASAVVRGARGAFVASSSGDELRFLLPLGAGAVVIRGGVAAIEELGSSSPTVRPLEGSVTVHASGRPDVMIAVPAAVGEVDGKKRPPAPTPEAEERANVQLAGSWQGTAGDRHTRVVRDSGGRRRTRP